MSDTNSMGGIEPPLRSIIREYEMSREGYANLAELFRNRAYIKSNVTLAGRISDDIERGRPTTVRNPLPIHLPKLEKTDCLEDAWREWHVNYPFQEWLAVPEFHPLAPHAPLTLWGPYERWLHRRVCDYIGESNNRICLYVDSCGILRSKDYSPSVSSSELEGVGLILDKKRVLRLLNLCLNQDPFHMSWGFLVRLPEDMTCEEYLKSHKSLPCSSDEEKLRLYPLVEGAFFPVHHEEGFAVTWFCSFEESIAPVNFASIGGIENGDLAKGVTVALSGKALSGVWEVLIDMARDYYGSWNWRLLDHSVAYGHRYVYFPKNVPPNWAEVPLDSFHCTWGGRDTRHKDTPFADEEIQSEIFAEDWREISDTYVSVCVKRYLDRDPARVALLNTHLSEDELRRMSPPEALSIVILDRVYMRFTMDNVDYLRAWLFRNRIGTILYLFDLTRSGYAPSDLDELPENKWDMLYTCFDAVFFAIWGNMGYAWFSRTDETQIELAGSMA